jgi:hypothetical protein
MKKKTYALNLSEFGPRILMGVAVGLFGLCLFVAGKSLIGERSGVKAMEVRRPGEHGLPPPEAKVSRGPALVEAPEGEEGDDEEEAAASAWSKTPGDFLSDVYAALEEGLLSELVHLPAEGMRIEFNRWSQGVRSPADMEGSMFIRLVSETDGVQVYKFVHERLGIDGLIMLELRDGRWHVVGVGDKS